MDRAIAEHAKLRALEAIKTLHSIVKLEADWTDKDLTKLKKGVGLSIGAIEVDLLSVIYKAFPDLDDLKP
jgi:hypothetical protein